MIHLNSNLLCAVDVLTTGPKPFHDDLIEICFLPLDFALNPHTKHLPFHLKIKPRRPENIDIKNIKMPKPVIVDHMINGYDADSAADLFDEWFSKLKLKEGKKIVSLGFHWGQNIPFLMDWLGYENMTYRISREYRDIMTVGLFLNDKADNRIEQIPFPKVEFNFLCNYLNIELTNKENCLARTLLILKCYRKMLTLEKGIT